MRWCPWCSYRSTTGSGWRSCRRVCTGPRWGRSCRRSQRWISTPCRPPSRRWASGGTERAGGGRSATVRRRAGPATHGNVTSARVPSHSGQPRLRPPPAARARPARTPPESDSPAPNADACDCRSLPQTRSAQAVPVPVVVRCADRHVACPGILPTPVAAVAARARTPPTRPHKPGPAIGTGTELSHGFLLCTQASR